MNLASITVKCDSSAPCDLLGKFFKDVRKVNGKEYEPSTLTGLQRRIQSFLSDSGSKMNILKDDEFAFSRKVLEAKRKNFVVQGKGNRPNATRSLTKEEEDYFSEWCIRCRKSRSPSKNHVVDSLPAFRVSGLEPATRAVKCAGEMFPCRRIQFKMAAKCLFG